MEKTFKDMYIIIGKRNYPDLGTLSSFKKECIKSFLKGSSMTWKEARKYGWRCEKTDVTIQTHTNDWQESIRKDKIVNRKSKS
jgi:hypothetical protein